MMKIYLTTFLVGLTSTVQASPMLTVSAQQIERGSIVSANDLTLVDSAGQPRRLGTLDSAAIIGKEARRTITAGQPIYGQDVQAPLLVKRNQSVTIVLSRGGLAIAASGKALSDGGLGAAVRVQNISSKQIVEGTVAADGVVRVASLSAPQIPAGF
jgi:flagellar basal body P-ring formation protein FlgA